jgi:hypothetical protein
MISATWTVDRGLDQLLSHGSSQEQQKMIISSEQRDVHEGNTKDKSYVMEVILQKEKK